MEFLALQTRKLTGAEARQVMGDTPSLLTTPSLQVTASMTNQSMESGGEKEWREREQESGWGRNVGCGESKKKKEGNLT